jgi:hypothetical protein
MMGNAHRAAARPKCRAHSVLVDHLNPCNFPDRLTWTDPLEQDQEVHTVHKARGEQGHGVQHETAPDGGLHVLWVAVVDVQQWESRRVCRLQRESRSRGRNG